jgi:class 3 adenylate cyclase
VEQRKRNLLKTAEKSDAIVSNMLPANVRDILYHNGADDESISNNDDDKGVHSMFKGGVIAELYPSATIVFADISRFTAWSSTREPSQVFILLETVYNGFDNLAKQRKVFKVETVGDCYVAVCGLVR